MPSDERLSFKQDIDWFAPYMSLYEVVKEAYFDKSLAVLSPF